MAKGKKKSTLVYVYADTHAQLKELAKKRKATMAEIIWVLVNNEWHK